MMRRIFAVDPGPSSCGWALVEPALGPKVRYLASGTVAPDQTAVSRLRASLMIEHGGPLDLVAIEEPSGFVFQPFRGPTLLQTAAVAGGLAWWAEGLCIPVVRLSSETVRTTLVGKTRMRGKEARGDRDKLVALALQGTVLDLPKRSNVHVRDALALAVVAHWCALRPGARP